MKISVYFCLFSFATAVYGKSCENMDPEECTMACPRGESKACELNICTCSPRCQQKADCAECPMIPVAGHNVHQQKHCIDRACECRPELTHPRPGDPGFKFGPFGR